MEEIKQKVQDLELALNYVCYDAALIPKLTKVWEKLELLQEAVNKKCNIPHVSGCPCFTNHNKMKKEFATKTLKRIKEIQETYHKLKALGVDLIDYENSVNLLEESVALLFVKDEKNFEKALNDVQWWLYENVDKIITLGDKSKVDVNTPESFIDWLERWYDVV